MTLPVDSAEPMSDFGVEKSFLLIFSNKSNPQSFLIHFFDSKKQLITSDGILDLNEDRPPPLSQAAVDAPPPPLPQDLTGPKTLRRLPIVPEGE